VKIEDLVLTGRTVRLEPVGLHHVDGLLAAANADPSLYVWTVVAQTRQGMQTYVETAMAAREAGTNLAFATIRLEDGAVVGSTRYFDMERWIWPAGHERHGNSLPDVCEIGYTWLTRSAIRTPANTEAKLMMLTHAFETWEMLRVCLHTDARNERSRTAMERIGCKFEGILRAHRMASDFIARDSARYSIIAAEWPEVKRRLTEMAAAR
jgi:RimJ/RimL family protein N-acetyltransferase